MAINYFDDRVQVSHSLNDEECEEVNNYLSENQDKYLRFFHFNSPDELSFIEKIPSAKNICIDYSSLENIDFLLLLPEVESLDISEMTGNVDVSAIKNFKKLKVLSLNLNKATRQTDLSILDDKVLLEELYFSGKYKRNSLSPKILKNIKILAPQLSTINFNEIQDLEHLKEIKLFKQKIVSLEGIQKFTSVEKILINGIRMDDQDFLSPIFDLPNLKRLNLYYLKFIEDFTFIKHNHNLTSLDLWTLNGLKSYNGIEKLVSLKSLEHCGEHQDPNGINFDNIESLKELEELVIKVGNINKNTESKIEKLISNISG